MSLSPLVSAGANGGSSAPVLEGAAQGEEPSSALDTAPELDKSSIPSPMSTGAPRANGAMDTTARIPEAHEPYFAPAPPEQQTWTPLFYDDFEDGDFSDWTRIGASNDWEIGTPSGLGGDPVGAFEGTYSIGNDLTVNGQYENNVAADSNYIYSPAINCAGQTVIFLEFMKWMGIESATWDHAYVQASNDGVTWTTFWLHVEGSYTDTEWEKMSFDISSVAANQATVYVRFDMGPTDSSVRYCGWNIDMVYVGVPGTASIPIYTETFEGDGTPTFGELGWTPVGASNDWQIGTPTGLGGDPAGPYQGTFSIGNDLTGLGTYLGGYENNVPADSNYIYSPAIDCTGRDHVTLSFYRWLGVESSTWDHAYIYVSTDLAVWNEVWSHNSGSFTDANWMLMTYDISAWAANQASVYIRFDMGPTDTSVRYCGWNIDMLTVSVPPASSTCVVSPEAASKYGTQGGSVAYLMSLENTGMDVNTFDLSVSGNSWPTTLYSYSFSGTTQDFTGAFPPTGWSTVQTCTTPNFGLPAWWAQFDNSCGFPVVVTAPSCAGMWWQYGGQDEWLISPSMDWSTVPSASLTFWSIYYWGAAGSDSRNYIEVSTNGGATWTIVTDLINDPAYVLGGAGYGGGGWNWNEVPVTVDLSAWAGNPSVMLAWHYYWPGSGSAGIWMIDDVVIDVYDASVEIDQIGPLNPGETRYFLAVVDIPAGAAPGSFDVARVMAQAETNPTVFDYSTLTTMTAYDSIEDDFETPGSYPWTVWDSGTGTAWEYGDPTGGEGPSEAASEDNCWGTNLWTDYTVPSECTMTSPPISLGYGDPVLLFDQWYEIDGNLLTGDYEDGGWVEISADEGVSWSQVFPVGGYNDMTGDTVPGYGDYVDCYAGVTGGWVPARFDLAAWEGQTVVLRFRFFTEQWGETSDYAGWYIDNVYIGDAGFVLDPDYQYDAGYWTDDVEHVITIYNTGTASDSYDLSVYSSAWPVDFVNMAGSPITSVLNVPAGGSRSFKAVVTVPYGTLDGASDVAIIRVDSWNSMYWGAAAVETGAMNPYGLDLVPDSDYRYGVAGDYVDYYFTVYNTGAWPDAFDLSVTYNSWYAVILDETGWSAIDETGVLQPGEGFDFIVRVFIPTGIPPGSWDNAWVHAVSQGDPSLSDTSAITTDGTPLDWFEAGPDMQTNFGWEGDWVVHKVRITNLGSRTDVYLPMFFQDTGDSDVDADWWTKFFFVDLRPQGIYNGIDDGSETWWWGPVNPGETKEYAIKVFVPTDEIGALDFATISITSQNDPTLMRFVNICTRLSMPTPFYDDFETAGDEDEFGLYYDDWFGLGYVSSAWTSSDPAIAGVNDMTSYSGDYSMYTSEGAVTVTSCKMNTEGLDRGVAACVIRRGADGFSEDPDYGEDLVIEYNDGKLQWAAWHVLDTLPGDGTPGQWYYLTWQLPEDALNPRFQIRFRQTGGSGYDCDYWHIDDVYVGPAEDWWLMSPGTGVINAGPGSTGSCQFTIHNDNYYADTYDITVSGNRWPVFMSAYSVGPLAQMGGTGTFTVYVSIPEEAEPMDSDSFTVIATSRADPSMYDTSMVLVNVCRVHNLDQDTWYNSIQGAINMANPGEHIYALNGMYKENVVVNKPLTITGEDRDATFITSDEGSTAAGGVYFVSTHTADAGWAWENWASDPEYWENGHLIDNALDWLWPTCAHNGPILLVWDNGAWGNSWKAALTNRAIPWDEVTGVGLTPAHLDPNLYSMIIMTEYMDDGGVAHVETMASDLQGYVEQGGVLVDMIATNNVRRWSSGTPGPFGIQTNGINSGSSYVVEPGHPMLTGITPPNTFGSSDTHGQITVAPAGSTVLMTAGDLPGGLPVACWLGNVGGGSMSAKVRITSNSVALSGFTVENGATGILLDSAFSCHVSGNAVRDCGAGVSLMNSGGNVIEGNLIEDNAGGSYLPNSIETMFAANNMQDGNMFDVTAGASDITVKGFDCNFQNVDTTPTTVKVYYKQGTYAGYEGDASAWTLLGTAGVMGLGSNVPAWVPIGGLTIPAGETYGIYFTQDDTASTNLIQYTNGANVYTDGRLTITTGCGIAYPFGTTFSPRTWNGRIYYTAGESTGPGIYVEGTSYLTVADDFSEDNGLWTWQGIARRDTSFELCSLTDAWDYGAVGRILYNGQINQAFVAEFDYLAGGGDGADGMAMNFFKEDYAPSTGGYLGAVDGDATALGYTFEIDNYDNGEANSNHFGFVKDSYAGFPHLQMTGYDGRTEDSNWHHVRIVATETGLQAYVDDMVTPVLDYSGAIDMTHGGLSFSAGTGGLTNNQWIDNVDIQTIQPVANVIRENTIRDNEVGVLLWNAGALGQGNLIHSNNFLYNGIQAYDNVATSWCSDNYPTEAGNYWSGYTGPDVMSGPLQNIPGADGIIDVPYDVDGDSQDLLPLSGMYNPATGRTPPTPVDEPSEGGTESVPEPTPDGTPAAPEAAEEPVAAPAEEPQTAPADAPDAAAPEAPVAQQPAEEPAAEPAGMLDAAQVPVSGSSPAAVMWLVALAACVVIVGVAAFLRKRK